MDTALVTGASGFIGYHVAKVLDEQGLQVRALVRSSSDRRPLAALGVELAEGDLRDDQAVKKAMRGCNRVYHLAADYRLWVPDPAAMYESNVKGTINVMTAALEAGVERVVYTSTAGVLRTSDDGRPVTEAETGGFDDMVGHYKKSKYLAEQAVMDFVRRGLPVVIVNPTAPIGPMDRKPTPTGKIVLDFLNGRMPAYLETGLNFVDVEDVARAHWLASERGSVGERYLLGNVNLSLGAFLELLGKMTGRKPPTWKLPYIPVLCAALIDQGISMIARRRTPAIPLTGVLMARHYMFFDCSKAVRELQMPQNSLEMTVQNTINWYVGNGYVSRQSGQKER